MLAKHIWDTLSQIDVSEFTEKKQNLTYLSWAHAWGVILMPSHVTPARCAALPSASR